MPFGILTSCVQYSEHLVASVFTIQDEPWTESRRLQMQRMVIFVNRRRTAVRMHRGSIVRSADSISSEEEAARPRRNRDETPTILASASSVAGSSPQRLLLT